MAGIASPYPEPQATGTAPALKPRKVADNPVAGQAYEAPKAPIAPHYVDAIKKFEGFSAKPKWDFKQYTWGYGTRAPGGNGSITPEQADAQLASELGKAHGIVHSFAPNAPEGVKAALTSLTYNAGDSWTRSGLGAAVKAGDYDTAQKHFLGYTKAGGQTLPGLVSRRQTEAQWFNGAPPAPGASPSASPSTEPSPMASGIAAPFPGSVPPSNEQIKAWRARGAPMLAMNDGSPTTGWGALGRIANTISGSMWMDKADKAAQEQQSHAQGLLSQYQGAGSGGMAATPAPGAVIPGASNPTTVKPASPTGIAGPMPSMGEGAPAIGRTDYAGVTPPPVSSERPQIAAAAGMGAAPPPAAVSDTKKVGGMAVIPPDAMAGHAEIASAPQPPRGLGGPAPDARDISADDIIPQRYFDPSSRKLTSPEVGRAPSAKPVFDAGQFVSNAMDNKLPWRRIGEPSPETIDVGEGETPYDFASGQGRMNAGLGQGGGVPGTAQGQAFAFNAGNAGNPFEEKPEAPKAAAPPITGLAAQTGAPKPQQATGPARASGEYEARRRVLSQMMLNPLTQDFAKRELDRLDAEMSPDAQLKRRQTELAITKLEEDIAAGRRMQDVVSGFLNGGQGATGGAASGGATGVQTAASGGSAPLAAGAMPPGTLPSGMQANSDTMPGMPPLSAEAARAQRLIELGGMLKDRAMVQAGQAILNADPTYEARKKQAEKLGESNAARAESRRAGAQILKSFAKLEHSFDTAKDEDLQAAIGPFATKKIGPAGWGIGSIFRPSGIDEMTPPQAAAAHPYNPYTGWGPGTGDARGWDLQNLLNHDVHGITTALIANAGKGLNMSDTRQEAFQATMKDFMRATTREEAKKVLDHAKSIIVNDFGLSPEEADAITKYEVGRLTGGKGGGEEIVRVNSPEEAARLKPGTRFISHDGREMVKR